MKIIAKKGSALEQTIKEMCERITAAIIGGQDIVEQAAGVRPVNIYHLFHWGIISRLTTDFVIKADDITKINPKVLRKKRGEKDVWVPAARYKEGRSLDNTFREFANSNEVGEESLHQYGIHALDMNNRTSYYCQPIHELDTGRYMLLCSDSIPKGFDKKKLAQEQFDIEY